MAEPEVWIERLAWPDVEARVAAGARRVIICAASSEQHGPQLPEACFEGGPVGDSLVME